MTSRKPRLTRLERFVVWMFYDCRYSVEHLEEHYAVYGLNRESIETALRKALKGGK